MLVVYTGARTVVSTLAGNGNPFYADGTGTSAGFSNLCGLAIDASGNVFVGDISSQRIRKVTTGGGTWISPVTLFARACCADFDVAARVRAGRASQSHTLSSLAFRLLFVCRGISILIACFVSSSSPFGCHISLRVARLRQRWD